LVQLDNEVNQMIKEEFQPFGNPYCITPSDSVVGAPICQAMIKYEGDKQPFPAPI
jgi:hypothetical protein